AAKALLSRIYLIKEDWQKAKNLAMEVTVARPLMTGASYPQKLFTLEETEALLQIAPNNDPAYVHSTYYQGGFFFYGSFLATSDIANLLTQNPNDKRKSWIKSGGIGKDTIVKYPIKIVPGFTYPEFSYFPTILRSSEMALIVAETAAKLGDENTAKI